MLVVRVPCSARASVSRFDPWPETPLAIRLRHFRNFEERVPHDLHRLRHAVQPIVPRIVIRPGRLRPMP